MWQLCAYDKAGLVYMRVTVGVILGATVLHTVSS